MNVFAPTCDRQAPALLARALSVGYRTRRTSDPILSGIDLAIHAGELVCVLGSNGIGKSTLLRTLVGLQPALAGHIELAGARLDTMTQAERARRVGVVLTERVVVEALTARRVVQLGRYVHTCWWGALSDADHVAIAWAIQSVGIGHLVDRDISRLSDGERQRVMIARALAQQPSLLVLDEPTAFLDVNSRMEMWRLLRSLASTCKSATLVSTHDLELALRTADRIVLLGRGRDVITGTPAAVIASGAVAEAFSSPRVTFDPIDRTFHFVEQVSAERTST